MYYIVKHSNINLFLVDRRLTKKQWWTKNLKFAMEFEYLAAARNQKNKLKYGDFSIVDKYEAIKLSKNNKEQEYYKLMSDCEDPEFDVEIEGGPY